MMDSEEVNISSRDFWFKIVDFLQQNWALIDKGAESESCTIYFIHDGSGVFDKIEHATIEEAEKALRRNGFEQYDKDPKAQSFIFPPRKPYFKDKHPNGNIYSSGRYWRK
jgi:hypothetical protein